ncbi:MAG: peptide-methionine (S)-S-oxide reductase MsrA [Bacteroidota bacterium]
MKIIIIIGLAAIGLIFFLVSTSAPKNPTEQQGEKTSMATTPLDTATFASGCFWCVEAVFQNLKGVQSVVSGYAGGSVANPTYEEVCSGTTGHAEACQIAYDPKVVTYPELLQVFWKTHDPTTLNRQGNDVGTQYRSAIFYHNDEQKKLAEHYKRELDSAGAFDAPIVTEIVPFTNFYKAENYHQNYFNEHGAQPYCLFVIRPKVEKFKKAFKELLKEK